MRQSSNLLDTAVLRGEDQKPQDVSCGETVVSDSIAKVKRMQDRG